MGRRLVFSIAGGIIVIAAGWKLRVAGDGSASKPAGPDPHHASRSQAGRLRFSSQVSRYFDPPSLERWVASGNITREQADHLRELLNAGDFEGAIRYGYSLPDTSLGRCTAVYYAWFCRAATDRDEALRSWKEKPELQSAFARDGLIQGFAFSDDPGGVEWLKRARAEANAELMEALHNLDESRSGADQEFSRALLCTLASMWLTCGEMNAKDFTALAQWQDHDERILALTSWSGMAAALAEEGRLPKGAALETLQELRSAMTEQATTQDPGAGAKDFNQEFGSATSRIAGAAASIADYRAPDEEPARHAFLACVGGELADQDPDKVAKLAMSDPQDGRIIWDGYMLKVALRTRDLTPFITRLSNADLPPELIESAMTAATGSESDEDPRLKGDIGWKIERLLSSDLKRRLLLRLAERLQNEGDAQDAQLWLDEANKIKEPE